MTPQQTSIAPTALTPTSDLDGYRAIDSRQGDRSLLDFPLATWTMLTPFRKQVITYIFLTARDLAGGRLAAANVSVTSIPNEGDTHVLDLTLTVDADWEAIHMLRRQIFSKIGKWSEEWSNAERDDYGRRIYFALLPREL